MSFVSDQKKVADILIRGKLDFFHLKQDLVLCLATLCQSQIRIGIIRCGPDTLMFAGENCRISAWVWICVLQRTEKRTRKASDAAHRSCFRIRFAYCTRNVPTTRSAENKFTYNAQLDSICQTHYRQRLALSSASSKETGDMLLTLLGCFVTLLLQNFVQKSRFLDLAGRSFEM